MFDLRRREVIALLGGAPAGSVAVMSKLVPLDGSEMTAAATSLHVGDQALLIR